MALNGSEVNGVALSNESAIFFSGGGLLISAEQDIVSLISGSGLLVSVEQSCKVATGGLLVSINQLVW